MNLLHKKNQILLNQVVTYTIVDDKHWIPSLLFNNVPLQGISVVEKGHVVEDLRGDEVQVVTRQSGDERPDEVDRRGRVVEEAEAQQGGELGGNSAIFLK